MKFQQGTIIFSPLIKQKSKLQVVPLHGRKLLDWIIFEISLPINKPIMLVFSINSLATILKNTTHWVNITARTKSVGGVIVLEKQLIRLLGRKTLEGFKQNRNSPYKHARPTESTSCSPAWDSRQIFSCLLKIHLIKAFSRILNKLSRSTLKLKRDRVHSLAQDLDSNSACISQLSGPEPALVQSPARYFNALFFVFFPSTTTQKAPPYWLILLDDILPTPSPNITKTKPKIIIKKAKSTY